MADYILNVTINGVEQSVQTIGQLDQALKDTNAELAKVDNNSQAFTDLQTQAKILEKEMNVLTKDTNQFNNSIKTVNATTEMFNNTIIETAVAANQLNDNTGVNGLNQGIQQASNSSQSLRTELRQITQELQGLEPGSQRFQQLSARAGELKDQIQDTNTVVGALAGNATERLGTALSGVVNVGITGLQGVVGGMKLFGVESERAREILEKLQGLLFLTQAIQGLGALPDSIAAIKAGISSLTVTREADLAVQEAGIAADAADTTTTGVNTAAIGANAVAMEAHAAASTADAAATGAATVATEGFTAALAANPIGLILVGLTALIATLAIFSGGQKTAADNTKELTDEMIAQADQTKELEKTLLELSIQRRKLEALSIQDATKRAEELKKIDGEYLKGQKEILQQQEQNINQQFQNNIQNFQEYAKLIGKVGEKEMSAGASPTTGIPVSTTVAVYDQIGKAELDGLRKNANNRKAVVDKQYLEELERLQKSLSSGLITQETYISLDEELQASNNIKKQRIEAEYYIQYLTKQKEFLSKSNKANDEQYAKNLDNAIKSFKSVKDALVKNLTEQLKIEQDAREKAIEEENKQAEEAARKRQAALEKARADYKSAYDNIVKTVKDANKQLDDLEKNYTEQITKQRLDQTKDLKDNIDEEKRLEKARVEEVAALALKDLNNSVLYSKKKKKLTEEGLKAEETININLKEALAQLDILYLEKRQLVIDEETKIEQEKADKIKLINEILAREISFGDQSISDQKRNLLGEDGLFQQQLNLEQIESLAKANDLGLKAYISYLQERAAAQASIAEQQREIDILVAEEAARKELSDFADLLIKEGLLSDTFNKEELDRIKLLTAEKAKEELKAYQDSEGNLKKNLNSEEQARAALLQTQINQQEQLTFKKKQIDQKYNNDKLESEKKTEDEILAYKLQQLEAYTKFATESATLVLGLFQSLADYQQTQRDNELLAIKEQNILKTNEINTNYNNELKSLDERLAAGLISQDQYNKASETLEKNRTNAITDLEKKAQDRDLKLKEKAFEQDKKLKIAQATIAGIQGAVSAFTGAFTSIPNPIAAAVVGGIFAALVGATTAVQIAQISKQKFDSTSGITTIDANSPSSAVESAITASSLPQGGGFTTFSEGAGSPGGFVPSTPFSGTSNNQRVYVVESDITAAQNRVRVLEENSTFG